MSEVIRLAIGTAESNPVFGFLYEVLAALGPRVQG